MSDMDLKTALEQIEKLKTQNAEYKQTQKALMEREEQYKQLFENSRDALMTLTPPLWKFTSANRAALELFGVSSVAEFITLGPWSVSPQQQPDGGSSAEEAKEMIGIAMRNGSNFFEWEHQTIDGKAFPADVLLTRLNINGQIVANATVRDISDKKKIEEKLRQERDFSTRLIENAPVIIVILDKEGKIVRFNRFIEKLTGYSLDEVKGKDWFETFLPENQIQQTKSLFLRALDDIQTNGNLNPILTKDGRQRVVEWHNKTLKDTQNNTIGLLGIGLDITERQHAEQILRESEEKFKSITASAQDAIIMMDNDGKISYWNEAAEKIFGYNQKEAIGQILHTLITPERFLAAHKIGFNHFKKTGEGPVVGKTLELVGLKKDSTEFPIELSLSATKIGGLWNAIGIIRDITERKDMENELKLKDEMMLAQSKQAAMGDMIAMIAHQWRQPLSVISMEVNNLEASVELGEEITADYLLEHAASVYEQLHQLSETIDNFRNFFKPDQSKEEITIKDVLNATLNIIGTSLDNNNITLNIKDTTKTSLLLNKSSLIQVLLNIIGNAKDALLAKEVTQATININVSETKEKITISICDNGGGVPEPIINKIDQPYFTTKEKLNGTGLGLYISRTIVEKHLFGTLSWHNEGEGACFVIILSITHNK